ncbi:copper homeostasis protein [Fusarium austroafricanum]|uniref:Copper homeostasis protein cutC homolog n=1 Tax=Fusarium austroafricanum TaxID=2364996 RepID=A0A8H4KC49_9HYPO|nr:copper homeostasis protein [Fusarium austroafricanum]
MESFLFLFFYQHHLREPPTTLISSLWQIPLEVTVYGPHNALKAANFGAKRLLLCRKDSSTVGGLTPSIQELRHLKDKIHVPISCVIRPRGAPNPSVSGELHDHIYSNNEFVQMSEAIRALKETGVMNPIRGDSFVFGCVRRHHKGTPQSSRDKVVVDRAYCRYLIDIARPFGCVFSRAFDHFAERGDWDEAITELVALGFTGFMTAGGPGYFYNHVERLGAMCHHVKHIQLIVAGGVSCPEAKKLRKHAHEYNAHSVWMNSECLRPRDHDDPETTDIKGVMSLIDQLGLETTD